MAKLGFHADASAYAFDPFLYDREADAGAWILFAMQAGKQTKDLLSMIGSDPNAIIFHPYTNELCLFFHSQSQ